MASLVHEWEPTIDYVIKLRFLSKIVKIIYSLLNLKLYNNIDFKKLISDHSFRGMTCNKAVEWADDCNIKTK